MSLLACGFSLMLWSGFILCRYTDAAAVFMKLGLAADNSNATNSQCKVCKLQIYVLFRDPKKKVVTERLGLSFHVCNKYTNKTC